MDYKDVALWWTDALTIYSGKNFDMSWEDSLKLFHIYSKEYEGKRGKKTMRIRKEIQEYLSNKPLEEVLMDKLKDNNGDYTFVAIAAGI